MLGRMSHCMNGPISAECAPIARAAERLPLKEELKLAIDYLCEFNEKLSKLSYEARNIVEAWLKEGKSY